VSITGHQFPDNRGRINPDLPLFEPIPDVWLLWRPFEVYAVCQQALDRRVLSIRIETEQECAACELVEVGDQWQPSGWRYARDRGEGCMLTYQSCMPHIGRSIRIGSKIVIPVDGNDPISVVSFDLNSRFVRSRPYGLEIEDLIGALPINDYWLALVPANRGLQINGSHYSGMTATPTGRLIIRLADGSITARRNAKHPYAAAITPDQ
jgi:hypothetical protein